MQFYFDPRLVTPGFKEYTIVKGDNLYQIAKKYNTTVNYLLEINNLTSDTLYPNQVILVPNNTSSDIVVEEYVTRPNDTIGSISKKLNVEASILGAYNDFSGLELEKGQKIKYPKERATYVIKDGDTWTTILSRINRSPIDLLELNATKWLVPGSSINI